MVNWSSNHTFEEEHGMNTLVNKPVRAEAPTPRFIAPGHYKLDSFRETRVAYDLVQGAHGWECNCYHYAHHYECKHVKNLLFWLQEQATVEALKSGSLASVSNAYQMEHGTIDDSFARYTAETEPAPLTLEDLYRLPPSPQEIAEARRLERVGKRR